MAMPKDFLSAKIPQRSLGACAAPMDLATGGQVSDQDKILDQPIFDTEAIGAGGGVRRVQFYRTQVNKTRTETNMPGEGSFPAPQTFTIHGLEVQILPDVDGAKPTSGDLQALRAFAWFELKQGNKPIFYQPLEKIPGPGLHANMGAAANGGYLNLGSLVISDIQWFGFSMGLPVGYTFGVDLRTTPDFPEPTVQYRVRMWALGFLSRATR